MTSIPILQLHNRVKIPELGYRIDRDHPEKIYDSVLIALDAGFRHFDLPCDAHSEELAGKAFRDSGIPRYELFLTMKLGNKDFKTADAKKYYNHLYDANVQQYGKLK